MQQLNSALGSENQPVIHYQLQWNGLRIKQRIHRVPCGPEENTATAMKEKISVNYPN